MRIALLTTLGEANDRRHGEAVAQEALRQLHERGHEVLVLGRRTAAVHRILGDDVEAACGLEFPREPADRERYLTEISAVLAGWTDALPAHDQVFDLISVLRGVDGLVIVGPALESPTGWLLYERAAAARIARDLGLPVALTGMGIGPFLSRTDTAAVRDLIGSAALVGVRDAPSHDLGRRLVPRHPRLLRSLDHVALGALVDASPSAPGPASVLVDAPDRHVLGRLTELVARHTGTNPTWLPEDAPASEARRLAAAARVVITTCRATLIAGLAGGAAVVALAGDHPTELRLASVLTDWEMPCQPFQLPTLAHAARDTVTWARVAGRLEETLEHTAGDVRRRRHAELRAADARWWDAVVGVLGGGVDAGQDAVFVKTPSPPHPAPYGPPNVAIVMRTKDRPLLLERALEDVLAQTYGEWHLVVVNDGGNPEPVESLVDSRRARFAGRISLIHHSAPRGMEAASNVGLGAIESTYVVIHDDDDQWHPEFLDTTVQYLKDPANRDDGVIVRTEIVYERIDGEAIVEERRERFWADLQAITLHDMVKVNRAVPISFLYRRSVHETIGAYDERLPAVGDWVFHLRFLASYTVGFIDGAPLAFWNQRPDDSGDSGNSVFEAAADHRKFDLLVREERFKEWVAAHGLGLPLYLTKMTEREVAELKPALDRLEEASRQHGESLRKLQGDVELARRALNDQRERLDLFDHSLGDRVDAVVRRHSVLDFLRRRYYRLRRP